MRAKGITYDTGFVLHGEQARTAFDPEVVRRELAIIRDDLHCTAVRITGGDPERLELAARCAADLGLEVWFSPYPLELTGPEMLALFADAATRAEALRRDGAEVVFVTGAELSLMTPGFLPGTSAEERVNRLLAEPGRLPALAGELAGRINAFLAEAVAVVRASFGGRVTYASVPLERVDWDRFDLVSVDLYRTAETAAGFADAVRALVAGPKPVAVTEVGTAAWRGAADVAPRSMEIAERDPRTGAPVRLTGVYERDEDGQAAYLREVLDVFADAGVDSVFVFLFALEGFPHRPDGDPRDDLDLASPAIVRMLDGRCGQTYPDLPWEPKAAFGELAAIYAPA